MNIGTKVVSKTETESLFGDLNKPSLVALSYALRHPEMWPKDFIWNYAQCAQCAMGLAHRLWASIPETYNATGATVMAREFAMSYTAAKEIFLGSHSWCPVERYTTGQLWWKEHLARCNFAAVTPDMVANQIDAYLANVE